MLPDDTTPKGLDELHRQARSAKGRLEPIWYLSLAYYYGEQLPSGSRGMAASCSSRRCARTGSPL